MPDTNKRSRSKARLTKDRVLQARIPEQLDEELRGRSEKLGLSVSTIVRNVLLHTFDLVEGVVSDSAQVARVMQGRDAAQTPPAVAASASVENVIGWQEAVLNRNGICETCNALLPRGLRAAVGVPVQNRPLLLCLDCLGQVHSDAPKAAAKSPRRSKKS